MKNKIGKRFILCVCFLMMLSALTFGAVACGKEEESSLPGEGELAGVWYCDVENEEYLITLNGNMFTMLLGDETVFGAYSYDGAQLSLTLAESQATALYQDGVLTLRYNNATYAFLRKINYTVTYDVNGGSAVASTTVVNGRTLSEPIEPMKENCNFVGWYADSEFKVPFAFGVTPITSDVTLYARFVDAFAGENVYSATLYVDGEVYGTEKTISGKLFNLPAPEKSGATFAGWWTSDLRDGEKLTAKYEDQTIYENINLYAVWQGKALELSVSASGANWASKGVNKSYKVKISDSNGTVLNGNGNGETTGETSYAFDFTKQAAGEYTVEVTVDGETTTAYSRNKSLARVSIFSVAEPSVLIFNAVENAEKYIVTVECGDETHVHTDVDNGLSAFYDFKSCTMQKGGIKFTVTAVADGYLSSTSETFVYSRDLEAVTGLTVDKENETLVWNQVANATSYVVKVVCDGKEYTNNVGLTTSYSLKFYAGELSIEVYPVADGYNSPQASTLSYTKSTLVSPTNLALSGKTLSWDAVDGAVSYVVKIGDNTFEATTNSFVLTDAHYDQNKEKCQVSVKAVGATESVSSVYSDAITVRFKGMPTVVYENGVLSWESVVSARKYGVQVNGGAIKEVSGDYASAEITLTKAGVNSISVCYYDEAGAQSAWSTVSVTAYQITFRELLDEATSVGSIFKAYGDPVTYPVSVCSGYTFGGWYDAQGGSNGGGKKYEDGTYTLKADVTLYAYWIANAYEAKLNAGEGNTGAQEQETVYYKKEYKLSVPTNKDAVYAFAGWYTAENGRGVQYTDETGASVTVWNDKGNVTLYAYWVKALEFTLLNDGTYSVSKGSQIDLIAFTELKVPTTYNGKKVTRVDSFAYCTQLLKVEIPDTIETVMIAVDGGNGAGSAFQGCSSLQEVVVYCENQDEHATHKTVYSSADGVLLYNNEFTGLEVKFVPLSRQGTFVIPEGVTVIPTNAFKNSRLSKVVIPATVKEIHTGAFESSSITEFEFVKGDEDVPLTIESYAFRKTRISSITLPSRLSAFDSLIFDGCTSLQSVEVDGTRGKYSSIDGALCEDVNGEVTLVYVPVGTRGEYEIPVGIRVIGKKAFVNAKSVLEIIIPKYIKKIDEEAFKDLTSLQKVTFDGDADSPKLSIEEMAFYGCTALKSVTLPENLGKLAQYAFGGTTNLTKVTVTSGDSTTLQTGAFASSTSDFYVTELTIGANVGSFDVAGVFGGVKLSKVIVDSNNNSFYATDDGILFNKEQTEILYYPTTRTGGYVIPETVTKIGAQVFRNKIALSAITIPTTVSEIGDEAFRDCVNLTTVTFETSESATSALTIGARAFFNTSVKTFTIPERTTTIGAAAFGNTMSLESVFLPASLTSLGASVSDVFDGCNRLKAVTVAEGNEVLASIDGVLYGKTDNVITTLYFCPRYNGGNNGVVTVPDSVTTICANAFENNSGVTEIKFGAVETITIETGAFSNARTLKTLSLPEGMKTIEVGLVSDCPALTTIVIPSTVTLIKRNAISDCPVLTSVVFTEGSEALTFNQGNESSGIINNCPLLTSFEIPSRTTRIMGYMFAGNTAIKSVTIPASVTDFRSGNFLNCTALETVVFDQNSTLTEIGKDVFKSCTSLTSVTLPKKLKFIGNNAFDGCTSLTTITLPSAVVRLNPYSFANATSLTTVVLPSDSKLAYIQDYAFSGCRNLRSTVAYTDIADANFIVPESFCGIGKYAFENCRSLENFTYTLNVSGFGSFETIGDYAFRNAGLTSFEIPNADYDPDDRESVEPTLGKAIFTGCRRLTRVKIPIWVTDLTPITTGCSSIGVFDIAEGNTSFSFVKESETHSVMKDKNGSVISVLGSLPETYTVAAGTTYINANAFANQDKVKKIIIPASVQVINAGAFKNCMNLETVEFAVADGEQIALTSIAANAFDGCRKLANIDLSAATNLKSVGNYAFANCDALTSLTLPASVDSLGTYLFRNSGLTSFKIPADVTRIADYTFSGCANLESVTLNSNLTAIGKYAFDGCVSLTEIDFSGLNGAVAIGERAFNNAGLVSVTLNSKIASVAKYAFANNANLRSVIVSANVLTNANVFENCKALASVTLSNVTSIGQYTFRYCESLTEIVFPESLTAIGTDAFNGTSITSVVLPKDLTSFSFSGCSLLESVTFSTESKLAIVPNSAFQNCVNLKSIAIPSTVTRIDNSAFYGCTSLSKFNINGAKLSSIGSYAFQNCEKLTSFELPQDNPDFRLEGWTFMNSGLTSIILPKLTKGYQKETFKGCVALASVTLNGEIDRLAEGFFSGCTALKTIELPENIQLDVSIFENSGLTNIVIPEGASIANVSYKQKYFMGCKDLVSVEIKAPWTEVYMNMFNGCEKLETIVLPETIQQIGAAAFKGCVNLKSIDLTNVSTVEMNAFYGCSGLESVELTGVVSAKNLGIYAFTDCTALRSVTFSNELTEIANYAFSGCTSLMNVVLPNALTTIGTGAFQDCSSITAIRLPDALTTLNASAFRGAGLTALHITKDVATIDSLAIACPNLVDITVSTENAMFEMEDGLLCKGNTILFYPMNDVVQDGVLDMGILSVPVGKTFASGALLASGVTKVIVPSTIANISDYMFQGCVGLTEIEIAEGVTLIGNYAFYGCTDLESITIPNSIRSIGNSAFYGCSALKEVIISEDSTLTSIGSNAFYGCAELATMTIPQSIRSIGSNAFYNCYEMKIDVVLPDGYQFDRNDDYGSSSAYAYSAFNSTAFAYSGIRSIEFPAGVKLLGESEDRECLVPYSCDAAFVGCKNLEKVVMNGVEVIGAYAFKDCTSLKEVVFSSNLKKIASFAFQNSGLEEVTIPASVTQFGNNIFDSCKSLKKVTFAEGLVSTETYISDDWGFEDLVHWEDATLGAFFSGCTSLETVIFPSTLEYVEEYMFRGCTGLKKIVIPEYASLSGSVFYKTSADLVIYAEASAAVVVETWSSRWNQGFNGTIVYGYREITE